MTVSTNNRTKTFVATGNTTAVDLGFPFINAADLRVIATDSDDEETVLTLGTHYNIGGTPAQRRAGQGTIIPIDIDGGLSILVERRTVLTQSYNIQNSHQLNKVALEQALDDMVMRGQDSAALVAKAEAAVTGYAWSASQSALAAADAAATATAKAIAAATSATTATTKAGEAATSAQSAAASEANAAGHASAANTSKNAAASSATTASDAATAAAGSASAAATSASAASTAKTAAESAKTAAETAKSAAETAQTAAENAQTAAETAKDDAETAKDAAETAAQSATEDASAASTSATNAANSESAAETAKTAAETAQEAAEAAQAAAEAARDEADSIVGGDFEPKITASTTAKYWRGDKSWQDLNKAAVGLSNVDNTSDANKPVSTAQQTALDGKQSTSAKGAANGYASLDSSGKVPESQLPAIAITDTFEVATQSAMLALTAQVGDVAVRSDLNKSFILKASPATTLANWIELRTPTDAVLSVAGKTGAVSLVKGDVGLGNVDNTSDASKPVSTAQQTALNAKLADNGDTYTKGYTTAPVALAYASSLTPAVADGHIRTLTNSGAFTLNAPSGTTDAYTIVIVVTNAASGAGALTASGFTKVHGTFATTANAVQLLVIEVYGSHKTLTIRSDA